MRIKISFKRRLTKPKKSNAERARIKRNNKRAKIYSRDGNECLCCGTKGGLTLDHIVPVACGGTDRYTNLQTLCRECNCDKADETIDYRRIVK